MKNKKFGNILSEYGIVFALFALIIVIGAISPEFRTVDNFLSLLRQSSINGFIAFGMTCVILSDGIDLSVGSVLALTSAFCASFMTKGIPAAAAMLIALVIGVAFGCISGLLVTYGKIQAFIATLVTQIVFRGFTMIFTEGKPISNLGDSFIFKFLGKGSVAGIPTPVVLFVIVFLIMWFILEKTTFGRRLYATGSNAAAAKLAGVNINKTKLCAYAISGFMAALSGLVLLSRLGSAQPRAGEGYELDAIAATAVGGTSMSGGRGRLWGTFVGILIIAVLNNGLNILGVSSYWQEVVKGAVILVAVLADKNR